MHPDDAGDDDEPIRPGASPEDADDDPDQQPPPSLHILNQEEIDEELDEEELDEAPRTVLITGANGNIGRKLREAWADVYDLVLIDRHAAPGDDEMIVADLAEWDESWVAYFDDVDTVVHLAGNPDDDAPWDALVGPNLDALANVFHASAFGGVERVIFASSNHVMGRYRDLGDMPITVDLPPRPDGPYGGTKLVGERLGKSLASAFDLTLHRHPHRLGPARREPARDPTRRLVARAVALGRRPHRPVRSRRRGRPGRPDVPGRQRHVEQPRHALGPDRGQRMARLRAGRRLGRGGALT